MSWFSPRERKEAREAAEEERYIHDILHRRYTNRGDRLELDREDPCRILIYNPDGVLRTGHFADRKSCINWIDMHILWRNTQDKYEPTEEEQYLERMGVNV